MNIFESIETVTQFNFTSPTDQSLTDTIQKLYKVTEQVIKFKFQHEEKNVKRLLQVNI